MSNALLSKNLKRVGDVTTGDSTLLSRNKLRYRTRGVQSFTANDTAELVEIRARQRTFGGAYLRTALGVLGYSVAVLRLFDERFFHIGILYAVFGTALFVTAFLRTRYSLRGFADCCPSGEGTPQRTAIKTVGQDGTRCFGKPFSTSGWIVLSVSIMVLLVELGLFVLLIRL